MRTMSCKLVGDVSGPCGRSLRVRQPTHAARGRDDEVKPLQLLRLKLVAIPSSTAGFRKNGVMISTGNGKTTVEF
jgi:hypothetical protein